jgi:hypothetical protein
MEHPLITFIVNGKTFSLRAGDSAALGAIPEAERRQLLALLDALKQQDERAEALVQGAVARATSRSPQAAASTARPERLGSGDVDALMARLVLEENRNRKPGPTRHDLYKWLLGFAAVVVLLVLILQ